jgi:hypothetical protein
MIDGCVTLPDQKSTVIPAKAGIQVEFPAVNGFPLSRE